MRQCETPSGEEHYRPHGFPPAHTVCLLWNLISSRTLHSKGFAFCSWPVISHHHLHIYQKLLLLRELQNLRKKSAGRYYKDREILPCGFGHQQTQTSIETGEVPPRSTGVKGHRKYRDWAMSEGRAVITLACYT